MTQKWNKEELKTWGHLGGHSLRGPGGYNGRWNLIPQLLESNELQRLTCEDIVYKWLSKKVGVEILIMPIGGEDGIKNIAYHIRPHTKKVFSRTDIPNEVEGITKWRERARNDRRNHRDPLSETLKHIDRNEAQR
jgi:hypothetical protein